MPQPVSYVATLSEADVQSLCQSATSAFTKARGYHRRVYFSWCQQCYVAVKEPSGRIAIGTQEGTLLCCQGVSGTVLMVATRRWRELSEHSFIDPQVAGGLCNRLLRFNGKLHAHSLHAAG